MVPACLHGAEELLQLLHDQLMQCRIIKTANYSKLFEGLQWK